MASPRTYDLRPPDTILRGTLYGTTPVLTIEKCAFSWFGQHEYFNSNHGALVYVCGNAYFILYTFIDFAYEAAPHDDKFPTGCDILDIYLYLYLYWESPVPIKSTKEILQSYSCLTAKLEL